MRRSMMAAALGLAALGGCEASDEALRNQFRQGAIEGCMQAAGERSAPAGIDWDRLCGCATDRVMEGKSGRELAQMQPGGEEQSRIVQQCLAEMRGGGGGEAANAVR